jgi:hypothetical protein
VTREREVAYYMPERAVTSAVSTRCATGQHDTAAAVSTARRCELWIRQLCTVETPVRVSSVLLSAPICVHSPCQLQHQNFNRHLIQEEFTRLNSGTTFYHSVQNLLSSRLLSKNVKVRI